MTLIRHKGRLRLAMHNIIKKQVLLPYFIEQNSFLPDTCNYNLSAGENLHGPTAKRISAKKKANNNNYKKKCYSSGNECVASPVERGHVCVIHNNSCTAKAVVCISNFNTKIGK
jgi:hypothetical protein